MHATLNLQSELRPHSAPPLSPRPPRDIRVMGLRQVYSFVDGDFQLGKGALPARRGGPRAGGFRVYGLGFRVSGSGCRHRGSS